MVRSEGLEPPTPWFEALYSTYKYQYNQHLAKRQTPQIRPKTA